MQNPTTPLWLLLRPAPWRCSTAASMSRSKPPSSSPAHKGRTLAKASSVSMEQSGVPDPGRGEAVARVEACGVCHTDLHYREGAISDEFPFLLGHEAAGVVERVGPDIDALEAGDFVILNWRAVCG